MNRTLIFMRTKRGADRLVTQLEREGVKAGAIHGDLRQGAREKALADFTNGKVKVLVATDVAARGIHVDSVDVVVHYDPAEDDKAYLHRSGRTAARGRAAWPSRSCCGTRRTTSGWCSAASASRSPWSRSSPTTPASPISRPGTKKKPSPDGMTEAQRRRPCHHEGMSRISRRVGAIEESATLAVDGKAKALQAAGVDVIGFGAGEPDFPTPEAIVEAAVAACREPRNHKYTPTPGCPSCRAAIAAKTARDSGYEVEPSQVLVTNGGKHAVYNTFQTLLDPGDEVLLPAPYWTTYPEAIKLADGVPVVVPATVDAEFRVTVEQLEAARTPRTKALVFVSPSNPSGAVYPPDRSRRSASGPSSTASGSSPTRSTSTSPTATHEFSSLPVLVPEAADTTLVLNGVAKTYAMTGWRVGWMIGPPDAITAAINLQSHQTSNVADVVAARRARGRERRPHRGRGDARRVRPARAGSCTRCWRRSPGSRASSRRARSTASRRSKACSAASSPVVRRHDARAVRAAARRGEGRDRPGEAFGTPGYARISFALGDDAIVEGIERIAKFLGAEFRGEGVRHVSRVLVAEKLAESGLEAMRVAGLEVDEQLDLSPADLLDAVRGAAALVIRSATQVTAEVLEAGDSLQVVGRAGIGLDNVDVDAATRRGVMVVNAPQSNRAVGGRAHDRVAARAGPQHPAGRS